MPIMYIIPLMDNAIFDKISPYISLGMLTVFAVFLVLGMLFGLFRGVKRAGIRLGLLVVMLIVAFFVTPFIVKALLGTNIAIMGKTPAQYADELSDQLVVWLQENWGDYVVPFQDYIKDYASGIVLAGLNLVLFFVMYIVVKLLSWVIYAIVARFAAPKRDRDGNKIKKHAGWGLAVGALQGVFLFVFFMLPVNGVIGVVNQAAVYQAMQTDEEQTATQTAAVTESDSTDNNSQIDVDALIEKFSGPLQVYSNVMKYSGLQALSSKAFEYQLTVRVENGEDINLVHDINSGLELAMDAKSFGKVLSKLQNVYQDGKIDLTTLNATDYCIMRNFLNKAFDLQVLNVANTLLADMDKILNTPFGSDETLLDGTDIYENSIYGLLIKSVTTEREIAYELKAGETVAPTNYAQFAKGVRAVVNYVGERRLNLVRDDLINVIDFVESLSTYEVKYTGLSTPASVAVLLANNSNGVQGYLDLSTAKLTQTYGDYAQGTPVINVLGDRLSKFELVKMLGLADVENLLVYNKAMDNMLNDQVDLKALVDDLIPMFLGENAFTHEIDGAKVQGNWERLGSVLLDVAGVLRDYVTIMDDLDAIKADLIANAEAKGKTMDATTAQARAILQYMANLAISKEYFVAHPDEFDATEYDDAVKYQKIDNLVNASYRLVNEFEPVKTFLISQLETMKTGDEGAYIQMLIDMLNQEKSEWESTMRNIVNAADIINNSALGDLIEEFQDLGSGNVKDLTDKLVDSITKLDADDVANMLTDLMDIPEVNDTVQDALTSILDSAAKDEDTLEELFGDEYTTVKADIKRLQKTISDMNDSTLTEEEQSAAKASLQTDVAALWEAVQQYLITNTDETAGV